MSHTNITNGKDWTSKVMGPLTAEVECSSWDGFLDFLNGEDALSLTDTYCFRGQASSNWRLKSTLMRAHELNPSCNIKDLEKQILKDFKNYCLGRRGDNPRHLNENEWWALGQEFGLKTPLLNWTESPYVAAYFAFNDENHETDNVTVWMLAKNINTFPEVERLAKEHRIEFLKPYLDENVSLLNQKGILIRPPQLMCISKWMEQFQSTGQIGLAKILIPVSEKKRALNSLDKMNINHLTLFSGLRGAAEYANYKLSEALNYNYTPALTASIPEPHETII